MAAVFEALIDAPFYQSVFGGTITPEMKAILVSMGLVSCFILIVTKYLHSITYLTTLNRVSMKLLSHTRRWKTYTAMNVLRTLGFAIGFCAACLLATCLFQRIW